MNNNFTEQIKLYSRIIEHWFIVTDGTVCFPHLANYSTEVEFFNKLCSLNDYITDDLIYFTFIDFICNNMLRIWHKEIRLAKCHMNEHVDQLIRSRLMTPPGTGIGCFCLEIAKTVYATESIWEEIELSKLLIPVLPYTKGELKVLQATEDQIRLGLLLTLQIGKFCHQKRIHITVNKLRKNLRKILGRANWNFQTEVVDCHRDTEIWLLVECLLNCRVNSW